MLPWVILTPLGRPELPEVKTTRSATAGAEISGEGPTTVAPPLETPATTSKMDSGLSAG